MKTKIIYSPPIISVQHIYLENGLAQASSNISPENQSGSIQVYDWDVLGDDGDLIISDPNNSSWQ